MAHLPRGIVEVRHGRQRLHHVADRLFVRARILGDEQVVQKRPCRNSRTGVTQSIHSCRLGSRQLHGCKESACNRTSAQPAVQKQTRSHGRNCVTASLAAQRRVGGNSSRVPRSGDFSAAVPGNLTQRRRSAYLANVDTVSAEPEEVHAPGGRRSRAELRYSVCAART